MRLYNLCFGKRTSLVTRRQLLPNFLFDFQVDLWIIRDFCFFHAAVCKVRPSRYMRSLCNDRGIHLVNK